MGKELRRTHGRRKPRRTILLVTNGQRTERTYLAKLRKLVQQDETLSVQVKSIPGEPMTVVGKVGRDVGGDYDEVWIVVDQDGKDRAAFLGECKRLSTRRQPVVGVVSVPCFEVWLIAHYERVGNFQTQNQAQERYRKVTGLIKEKQKELPSDFPWDKIPEACERSRLKGVPLPEPNTLGPCPSTAMPHLVKSLGLA